MATFDQVRKKIAQLPENIKKHTPSIIAETATEYSKNSFRVKSWDGVSWTSAKNPLSRGSLLVRSGQLQASIRPSLVSANEVRISAGSSTVPYAKAHNEGATIKQIPTAKQRRFFWAMEYANNAQGDKLGQWGRMAIAKQLTINIPKRQFIGLSPILNKQILERLKLLVKL